MRRTWQRFQASCHRREWEAEIINIIRQRGASLTKALAGSCSKGTAEPADPSRKGAPDMTLQRSQEGAAYGSPPTSDHSGRWTAADDVPPFDPRNPTHVRAWEIALPASANTSASAGRAADMATAFNILSTAPRVVPHRGADRQPSIVRHRRSASGMAVHHARVSRSSSRAAAKRRVERERSRRERELAAIERPSRIRAEQERARRYLDRYSSSGGHRPPILVEIEAAMLRHGIRAASFGEARRERSQACLRPSRGRTLRDSTAGRVRAFIASLDAKRAAND
jgi:hypothetical protein